jgi:SAM-dependent methyltransferase
VKELSPQSSVLSPRFGEEVAERYDGFRALPEAVVDQVRDRIVAAANLLADGRVLDLGAGTGRLARPFLAAGFRYAGIDRSSAMLARLRALPRLGARAELALASGTQLPFAAAAFDLVLAVQVLGVIPDWPLAVRECRRVLRPGGSVVLGRVTHDPDSLQASVRRTRMQLLRGWGVETQRPGAEEDAAAAALVRVVGPVQVAPAVTWTLTLSPREAIAANLSGWRVQALPEELRERLQQQLTQRIRQQFGDLDAPRDEQASFSMRCFRLMG